MAQDSVLQNRGQETLVYTSVYHPFPHGCTPEIIFRVPRNHYPRKRLQVRPNTRSWLRIEITPVLPNAGQNFRNTLRDIWNFSWHLNFFYIYSTFSHGTPKDGLRELWLGNTGWSYQLQVRVTLSNFLKYTYNQD